MAAIQVCQTAPLLAWQYTREEVGSCISVIVVRKTSHICLVCFMNKYDIVSMLTVLSTMCPPIP
jgi:hypothetical protein